MFQQHVRNFVQDDVVLVDAMRVAAVNDEIYLISVNPSTRYTRGKRIRYTQNLAVSVMLNMLDKMVNAELIERIA